MNNGEMMIFENGKMHRAIAQAETTLLTMGKKITYEGMSEEKIPITQYATKRIFFDSVDKVVRSIEFLNNKEFLNNPKFKKSEPEVNESEAETETA